MSAQLGTWDHAVKGKQAWCFELYEIWNKSVYYMEQLLSFCYLPFLFPFLSSESHWSNSCSSSSNIVSMYLHASIVFILVSILYMKKKCLFYCFMVKYKTSKKHLLRSMNLFLKLFFYLFCKPFEIFIIILAHFVIWMIRAWWIEYSINYCCLFLKS